MTGRLRPFKSEYFYDEETGEQGFICSGAIDEDAILPPLQDIEGEQIVFDLGGVTFINSLGIRKWLHWLDELKNFKVIFEKVPSVLIDQINVVDGFLPQTIFLKSFFVPYVCETCELESQVIYHEGREFSVEDSNFEPVKVYCQDCQTNMEVSSFGDRYFYFLGVKSHNTKF